MASATSVSNAKSIVKIVNPVAGGATHTTHKRAMRFIAKGRARFNSSGQLVFHGQSTGKKSSGKLPDVEIYSGQDAFPGRAVFPPSPEAVARMEHKSGVIRVPLRPPAFSGATR